MPSLLTASLTASAARVKTAGRGGPILKKLVLPLLAAAAFGLPVSAGATPPVRFSFDAPIDVVYQPCGLHETGTFHFDVTSYVDASGTETFSIWQVYFDGVIANETTGETWLDSGHVVLRISDGGESRAFAGPIYSITMPGEGVVLLSAGRLINNSALVTVFHSARSIPLDETDAAVCAALTG